jgi:hypothetical protein
MKQARVDKYPSILWHQIEFSLFKFDPKFQLYVISTTREQ